MAASAAIQDHMPGRTGRPNVRHPTAAPRAPTDRAGAGRVQRLEALLEVVQELRRARGLEELAQLVRIEPRTAALEAEVQLDAVELHDELIGMADRALHAGRIPAPGSLQDGAKKSG